MALNHPSIGEGYAPAYTISATPFVTSSNISLGQTKCIDFGMITRFITLKNTGPSTSVLAVSFTENGLKPANSNYLFLSGSESFSAELRLNKIFLSGSAGTAPFTLVAGLTFIKGSEMMQITGSNGFNGVG